MRRGVTAWCVENAFSVLPVSGWFVDEEDKGKEERETILKQVDRSTSDFNFVRLGSPRMSRRGFIGYRQLVT